MYPDFGWYMLKEKFQCFVNAAAFAWADKNQWFVGKRDKT